VISSFSPKISCITWQKNHLTKNHLTISTALNTIRTIYTENRNKSVKNRRWTEKEGYTTQTGYPLYSSSSPIQRKPQLGTVLRRGPSAVQRQQARVLDAQRGEADLARHALLHHCELVQVQLGLAHGQRLAHHGAKVVRVHVVHGDGQALARLVARAKRVRDDARADQRRQHHLGLGFEWFQWIFLLFKHFETKNSKKVCTSIKINLRMLFCKSLKISCSRQQNWVSEFFVMKIPVFKTFSRTYLPLF